MIKGHYKSIGKMNYSTLLLWHLDILYEKELKYISTFHHTKKIHSRISKALSIKSKTLKRIVADYHLG